MSVLLDTGEAFVGCMAHEGFPFRFRPGLPIYAQNIETIKANWRILIDKGIRLVYPGLGRAFPVSVMKKVLGYSG